jgi:multidrug resistance efflux pump
VRALLPHLRGLVSSKRRLAASAAVVAVLALIVFRRHEKPADYFVAVSVQQGALHNIMRESGTLRPREPVLVKCPFIARIEYIVDEGSWVEQGDTLFILNEEEELKRVADERNNLLGVRQELRLAQMRRAFSADSEAHKVTAAKRRLELEAVRYRILAAKPVGGDELVRLHEQLTPLENKTKELRKRYEKAEAAYQHTFDQHLDAADALQNHRDALMRLQARIDELQARVDVAPENLNAAERTERDTAEKELPDARGEQDKLKGGETALVERLAAARAQVDEAQKPRNALAGELAERELNEQEYYIRIEIEKRGLPLAKLRLDHEAGTLSLAEAERKLEQGRQSFAHGALSRSALDDLEAAARRESNQLRIIEEKIAIADRPLAPELEAEAKVKLETAQNQAAQAEDAYKRALAIQDQEIAVLKAQERRWMASIDTKSRHFPSMIEANIEFAEKELAALDSEEVERRGEITRDIARLRAELEAAKANPPNVIKAPVSGIVWIMREGERPRQAGDKAWDEDALVELHPPGNMEVVVKVNEVNVKHVSKGMPATITIPALADAECPGEVSHVSAIGRDKFADAGDGWNPGGFADVTQFDLRCSLRESRDDVRQGMTAIVSILLAEKATATWLPLGAVTRTADGWTVLTGSARRPSERAISGEPFGTDFFIVSAGVQPGETVFVKRTRNQ